MPTVSVILPTYNREAYLREALGSVFAQTCGDWELIVVDDGSTDGTPRYLASLSDPRVRVVRSEHTGNPNRARNLALAAARGRYVAFLDSDDRWEPDKLALQLGEMAARPECEWSYTSLSVVDEEERELPAFKEGRFVPYAGRILERLISGDAVLVTPTVMARRTLIEAAGGFDESFVVAGDFDLWVRLAERSPVSVVPRALVTVRRHPGGHGVPYRGDFETLNRVFERLMAKAASPGLRRLYRRRRLQWLLKWADHCRQAGHYTVALTVLGAALPRGAASFDWWIAAVKTLARPWLPGRLLAVHEEARGAPRRREP